MGTKTPKESDVQLYGERAHLSWQCRVFPMQNWCPYSRYCRLEFRSLMLMKKLLVPTWLDNRT
jgi:hypothetical protein